ncbi:MAG: phosphoglucosamine mutase [Bryobacterales bacterium]|nr:phosphoglucosamine mutase [Bryobacterales bacterium]
MARELFGTDGLRGVAGEYPLDPPTICAVGVALGRLARRLAADPEVILGIDTRESGPAIARRLAGGLAASGVRTRFAGVITTPGVAYLTRTDDFVAGVIVSASHNPFQDNGIKIFGHSGYKLPDGQEHELEAGIFELLRRGVEAGPVELTEDSGLDRRYLEFLASTFPHRLDRLRIVIDCANGAAGKLGPELLERLGAHTLAIHCSPDGRNINLNSGALHVEPLRQAVLDAGADLGVALDGDADRAIFVSKRGAVVDGDAVLLMTARHLLQRGELSGPGGKPAVVSTVMSNLGLERALAKDGIHMPRTPVGDKYVLEEMRRIGAVLGGEQSGHVIFHNYATTGDGLLTTLRVLEVMLAAGRGPDELTSDLERYPQRLVNVRVRERRPFEDLPEVARAMRAAEDAIGDRGRILVRYSGTELLARVMIESADGSLVEEHSQSIAGAIERAIGATREAACPSTSV